MPTFKDLTGHRFGMLTVLSRAESAEVGGRKRTMWNCLCDCGNTKVILGEPLSRGTQVSCGCYRRKKLSELTRKHGKTDSRLYNVWIGIRKRCYSETCEEFKYYGGRGIKICDEWLNDYINFYNWAIQNGYDENAPRGKCTIDRIDVNGNYSPENCRIVTQQEQMNNTRVNHLLTHNGETHTIAEWSRITGIDQMKIRNRIVRLGWTVGRALEMI